MKVKVQQIVWHNKEPVFSADFHPSGVLATAGADSEIKLWIIKNSPEHGIEAEFVRSITGDKFESGYKAWNCIRFSPNGRSLAAAGDAGQIFQWKPLEGKLTPHTASTLQWKVTNCGAYSNEDVMDVCWASDGSGFVTASNDMTCMFWDPEKVAGKAKLKLEGHRLFVQGIAWDPLDQAVVSQAADRSMRVYSHRQAIPGTKRKASKAQKPMIDKTERLFCAHVISRHATQNAGQKDNGKVIAQPLFLDDSLGSFFRRLAWSPDGSLLVVPAGVRKMPDRPQSPVNVAYVYAKGHWSAPLLQLPVTSKPVVAVSFCPVLYQLEADDGDSPVSMKLPYRMVFALATKDSVILYTTQTFRPLAILGGLHLEVITDMAWSMDGQMLVISSYDGYCSVATFGENELGTPLSLDIVPKSIRQRLRSTAAAQTPQNKKSPLAKSQSAEVAQCKRPIEDSGKKADVATETGKRRLVPMAIVNTKQEPQSQPRESAPTQNVAVIPSTTGPEASTKVKRIAPTPILQGLEIENQDLKSLEGKGIDNRQADNDTSATGFKRLRRIEPILMPLNPKSYEDSC